MSGVIGYSLKGIDAEISKGKIEKSFSPIIAARMAQGELEYLEASEEEKKEIIERWVAKVGPKKDNRKGAKKGKEKEGEKISENE